eukprot:13092223-Alexandrium_andersonii.AAC.1
MGWFGQIESVFDGLLSPCQCFGNLRDIGVLGLPDPAGDLRQLVVVGRGRRGIDLHGRGPCAQLPG